MATDTVNRKGKVNTRKGGAIIGQRFVKGRQLKGESNVEFYDAASAAEIDATDALNKDRIPRVYRKGVKAYFDRLGDQFRPRAGGPADSDAPQDQGEQSESPEGPEDSED